LTPKGSPQNAARRWTELLEAARTVFARSGDPSAAADYGSRYGLLLLQGAEAEIGTSDECELMIAHGETWLTGIKRSRDRIRWRLLSQFRRYRDFAVLPPGVRDSFDEFIGELERSAGRR
jgi:hypothetical protein